MSQPPHPGGLEIDCQSVRAMLESDVPPLLVDCRERDEYDIVRLESARLIPMSELLERAAELNPHRREPIVVYCHHGVRSLQVVMWLRSQGFTEAVSLAGGIDRWATDIDPRLPRY